MTGRAEEITRYDFTSSGGFLLDANVWLFIYGPQKPGDKKSAAYSEALKKIQAAERRIYIDVLVVSEFINRYARLRWKLLPTSSKDFKQFRKSADFGPIAQDIAADVGRVLRHCIRVESGFRSLAIDALLDEYALGDSDFNDQILAKLCMENGLILVTDDADFGNREIPVVTANKRLLA